MIDGFHAPEYQFLSNFYELRPEYYVSLRNQLTGTRHTFRTTEHAYQAGKVLDDKLRERIRDCRYAGQAKKLGKTLKAHVRPDWEQINLQLMGALLRQKIRDPLIRDMLLATGDEYIRESNWWGDDFWGVIIARGGKPCRPEGQNHLGKLWMTTRQAARLAREAGNT